MYTTFDMELPEGAAVDVGQTVTLVAMQRDRQGQAIRFPGRCFSVNAETREAVFELPAMPEGLWEWILSGIAVDVVIAPS